MGILLRQKNVGGQWSQQDLHMPRVRAFPSRKSRPRCARELPRIRPRRSGRSLPTRRSDGREAPRRRAGPAPWRTAAPRAGPDGTRPPRSGRHRLPARGSGRGGRLRVVRGRETWRLPSSGPASHEHPVPSQGRLFSCGREKGGASGVAHGKARRRSAPGRAATPQPGDRHQIGRPTSGTNKEHLPGRRSSLPPSGRPAIPRSGCISPSAPCLERRGRTPISRVPLSRIGPMRRPALRGGRSPRADRRCRDSAP